MRFLLAFAFLLLAAFICLAAMVAIASAGMVLMTGLPCDATKEVVDMLSTRYKERPVAGGVAGGEFVQRTESVHGTWTIIRTNPASGLTCIVAAGTDWSEKPKGDDL